MELTSLKCLSKIVDTYNWDFLRRLGHKALSNGGPKLWFSNHTRGKTRRRKSKH